jgi:hypothetical protein
MGICAAVGKPLLLFKLGISLGYHGCQLIRKVAPLVGVVHPMEAVKRLVAIFAINLARGTGRGVERRPIRRCYSVLYLSNVIRRITFSSSSILTAICKVQLEFLGCCT